MAPSKARDLDGRWVPSSAIVERITFSPPRRWHPARPRLDGPW